LWVVKSEIATSGPVLYSFVTHVLTFFYKVGIGSATWSSFGSKVPNTFLRRGQSQFFIFPTATTPAYAGCSRWIWTNFFWCHLLLQRAAYLCH
jgi:hypothetical protein